MIWVFSLIAASAAFATNGLFYLFSKRHKAPAWLLSSVILLAATIAQQFSPPFYQVLILANSIKQEDPIFALLAKESPNTFHNYLIVMQKNMLAGNSKTNELVYTSEYVNHAITQYAQHASDASLYYYLESTIDFYKKLIVINPVLVLKMEFPKKFPDKQDLNQLGSDYNIYFKKILAAKRNIIQSALSEPQPTMTAEQTETAKELLRVIILDLSEKYRSENIIAAFEQPNDPATDKKISAEIVLGLYDGVLNLGKEDASMVLKYIFQSNSQ